MGIWFVYGAILALLVLVLALELSSRRQAKHQRHAHSSR